MTPYGSLQFSCMRAQTRNQFRKKKERHLYKIKLAKSCIYVFIENQEHPNEVELVEALEEESSSYDDNPSLRPSFDQEVSFLGR